MPVMSALMVKGQNGQEGSQKSRSCRSGVASGLQTAEVRLSQDSVDVVVRGTAAVTMETML